MSIPMAETNGAGGSTTITGYYEYDGSGTDS